MAVEASLILPTRNRPEILRLSLERLLRQTVPSGAYEILLVDDGDEDSARSVALGFQSDCIAYRRAPERRRIARSRNLALSLARSPLALFVDDDSFVEPDFIERHIEAHRRWPRSMVSGPILEVRAIPRGGRPRGRWRGWHTNPLPCGNASAPLRAIREAGGFEESFDAYGWEDLDLAFRLRRQGIRRRFDRRCPIYHYKPERSAEDWAESLRRERERGTMGALLRARYPGFELLLATKSWAPFRWLDRIAAFALRLDQRERALARRGAAPGKLMGRILLMHAEIDGGRAGRPRRGADS